MSIELLGLTLGNETISLKEPSSMVITRAWDSPVSQRETVRPETASFSASCSCVNPFSLRSALRNAPILI